MKKIFVGIFIGTVLSASNLMAKLPDFNLIDEGYLPEPISYNIEHISYTRELKSANLLGNRQEFILIKDKSILKILQFVKKEWKTFYEITLDDSNSTKNIKWTTGDFNNDGKDEIILFKEHSMIKYEWNGKEFGKTVNELPYLIGDALIGDVNTDRKNELVTFCYENPLKKEDTGCKYYICIIKTENDSLRFLWTDKGELGYINSNIVPSAHLLCIANVDTNYKQLVIAESQSDVSPTTYDLLMWNKNKLERTKSFIVAEGNIITKGYTEERPFLLGYFKPIYIKEKEYFLGCVECAPDSLHPYHYSQTVIFEMKNNFRILKSFELTDCDCNGFEMSWINLDGKGKGVMGLYSGREDKLDDKTEVLPNTDEKGKKQQRAYKKGEKEPDYKTKYLFYR
ncbi:MAG: VCBS repeat-containing protein [bacterium]|nr:VCBS repeat-containing protein [bacterium]